ncbi:MAG TPA: hypothetical protein VFM18_24440, partial [Methanosarcina sp.]|nr:hypothetical protein [Methanosarcina sp.]
MAARSIIQVDVLDGAWKNFERSVKKHQIELKQMPGQWGAVGIAIGKTQNAAAKFVASIVETSRQFNKANGAAAKMTLALKASDRVATALGRSTLAVAKNLKDATKSLFSWLSITGLFSGLLGAGGLFGI